MRNKIHLCLSTFILLISFSFASIIKLNIPQYKNDFFLLVEYDFRGDDFTLKKVNDTIPIIKGKAQIAIENSTIGLISILGTSNFSNINIIVEPNSDIEIDILEDSKILYKGTNHLINNYLYNKTNLFFNNDYYQIMKESRSIGAYYVSIEELKNKRFSYLKKLLKESKITEAQFQLILDIHHLETIGKLSVSPHSFSKNKLIVGKKLFEKIQPLDEKYNSVPMGIQVDALKIAALLMEKGKIPGKPLDLQIWIGSTQEKFKYLSKEQQKLVAIDKLFLSAKFNKNMKPYYPFYQRLKKAYPNDKEILHLQFLFD